MNWDPKNTTLCTGRRCLSVAVIAISLGCGGGRPRSAPEQGVVDGDLVLRAFQPVRGTDVFRADLTEEASVLRSGGYRLRNVLFVESSGKARWLLPDHKNAIEEHDVRPADPDSSSDEPPVVATVVLARVLASERTGGNMYLCDRSGRKLQRIAEDVTDIDGVTLSGDRIVILYERGGAYRLAQYAVDSFAQIAEVGVDVPAVK
jgi:hypothetical protein